MADLRSSRLPLPPPLLFHFPELGRSYEDVTQMLEAAQNYTMIFK
jgi:hypothetical protein